MRIQQFAAPLMGVMTHDLEARRPEKRARAVQIVSCLGGDDYEETVARSLDDPSTLVSLVAARALAQPNRVRWIGAILDRLLHSATVLNIQGRSYRLRDLEAELSKARESAPSDVETPASAITPTVAAAPT